MHKMTISSLHIVIIVDITKLFLTWHENGDLIIDVGEVDKELSSAIPRYRKPIILSHYLEGERLGGRGRRREEEGGGGGREGRKRQRGKE